MEVHCKLAPRDQSNTVDTPHPHPASLTCSEDVLKQNPHHPTPPSSSTEQHTYGIFMNVTRRSTARQACSCCFKSVLLRHGRRAAVLSWGRSCGGHGDDFHRLSDTPPSPVLTLGGQCGAPLLHVSKCTGPQSVGEKVCSSSS